MSPEKLNALISGGETISFELKTSLPRPDLVSKILGAFANTSGGVMAFGIQEPRKILGVDPMRARKVLDLASQMLSPSQEIQIEEIQLESKTVVIARIQRSLSLVASQGAYYMREGDRVRAISAQKISAHFADSVPERDSTKEMAEALVKQTEIIEGLREDFSRVNSIKRKIAIGGGGAAVGAILKALVGFFAGG